MFPALMAWLAQPAAATLVTAGSAAVSTYAQSRNANKLANQGTDLGKLRREAEANGFNPLTVLRATGGQGFKQNVSLGSGALASAAFFNSFAGLGQNIAQAKQQEATLKNTMASTANYTAQTRSLSSSAFGQVNTLPAQLSDVQGLTLPPDIRVTRLDTGEVVQDTAEALFSARYDANGERIVAPRGDDLSEALWNAFLAGAIKVRNGEQSATQWLNNLGNRVNPYRPYVPKDRSGSLMSGR
jgi:hypothetical protein